MSGQFNKFSPQIRETLFGGIDVNPVLSFNIDDLRIVDDMEHTGQKISVSGVQEKFPAIIKGGEIRIAEKNERSTHILKPYPRDVTLRDRKLIPANEHLTMQIASQVYGIKTAPNGLCFTPKGHPVYITRRFDILEDGTKIYMEDFASLNAKNKQTFGRNYKYTGNYEDIARVLKERVASWIIDVERLFNLIVFNYIYGNGDAHLKNFSLIMDGDEYRLAPAYDLINTQLHINDMDFGLEEGLSTEIEKSDVYERTGHPCRVDFESFGDKIGIGNRRIEGILNKYTWVPDLTLSLTGQSFLSEKAKRNYLRIINERISRFNRQSE